MKPVSLIVFVCLALLQAGCASLDQGECLIGDWSRIGYQDGAAGHPPSRLSDHAKACAAHGVRPDADLYMAGREQGLGVYCTPYRGFEAGRLGRSYHGVCPPPLAGGFLAGYDDGLRVHAANEHRDGIARDVRRFDSRIREVRGELDDIRDRMGDSQLATSEREKLEDHYRDLQRDLRHLQDQRESASRLERAASRHADGLRLDLSRYYR